MGPHAWRWRPANPIVAACRCAVIKTTSKRPKGICTMRRPVMERIFAPILQPIIILTTILAQRFNALSHRLQSIQVRPSIAPAAERRHRVRRSAKSHERGYGYKLASGRGLSGATHDVTGSMYRANT